MAWLTPAPPKAANRPFAAYLGTQASWFFGFGLQSVLLPYTAVRIFNASDAQLGLVQASPLAPVALLILLGGVAAERRDRRDLLMLLHMAAVAPPAALAAAAAFGVWSIHWLIAFGLAIGTTGAIMMPTRDAALNAAAQASVGRLSVQRAVVLASLVQFAGQVAGMSAAIIATAAEALLTTPMTDTLRAWQAGVLFGCQAAALAAGWIGAYLLPRLTPPSPRGEGGVARQVAEGLAVVWRSPVIRPMALLMVAVGVFVIGASFLVLLPNLVLDAFGGGLGALGFALIVFWLGAAAATIALTRFHVRKPGRLLVGALALGATSLGVFAFHPPFVVVVGLVFFWGVSGGLGIAMSRAIVQEKAPPQALARVLSIYQLGFVGGAPIGSVGMGFLVEHFGPQVGAFTAMAGVLATCAWLAFFTPIGRLRGSREPASREAVAEDGGAA